MSTRLRRFIYVLFILPPVQTTEEVSGRLQMQAATGHSPSNFVSTCRRGWWFAKQVFEQCGDGVGGDIIGHAFEQRNLPKGELPERQVKLNEAIFHHLLYSLICIFYSSSCSSPLGQLNRQEHGFQRRAIMRTGRC